MNYYQIQREKRKIKRKKRFYAGKNQIEFQMNPKRLKNGKEEEMNQKLQKRKTI